MATSTASAAAASASAAADGPGAAPSQQRKFKELLEQSRQLVAHIDTHGLPPLSRSFQQIDEVSRRLHAKAARAASSVDTAYSMLAKKGFDAERFSRQISSLNIKAAAQSLEPIGDTDVAGFLKSEYRSTLTCAIEEAFQNATTEFEITCENFIEREWNKERDELMATLSHGSRHPMNAPITDVRGSMSGASAFQMPRAVRSVTDPSPMTGRMLEYSEVMQRLCASIVDNEPFPVCGVALETTRHSRSLPDQLRAELVSMWDTIRSTLGEPSSRDGKFDGELPPLDEIRRAYATTPMQPKLRSFFLGGALNSLEHQFLDRVRDEVARQQVMSASGAMRGGDLNPLADIRSLVQHKLGDSYDDDVYTYALVFYALRAGLEKEVLREREVGSRLKAWLRTYIDNGTHPLERSDFQEIQSEYNKTSPHNVFKLVVLNVLARLDPHNSYSTVCTTIEDFLWLKLKLARVVGDMDEQFSDFRLEVLQQQLLNLGPSHFSSELTYFRVLVLCQVFEEAVEMLIKVPQANVEALHAALAFYYYGCLNESVVPLSEYLMHYVHIFAATDAKEAAGYFCVLRDRKQRVARICDLVLESRDSDVLLGSYSRGTVTPGILQHLLPKQDLEDITRMVAKERERTGEVAEAVCLYDLLGDYSEAVDLLVRTLSPALPAASGERFRRLWSLAYSLHSKYRSPEVRLSAASLHRLELLLQLEQFFSLVDNLDYRMALTLMERLDFVPLSSTKIDAQVAFVRELDDNLRSTIGPVLTATMTCIEQLYRNSNDLRTSQYLRGMARALVLFSGQIPMRLPGATIQRLSQIEASLA